MKIHFCDLCNESVPQAALDSGAARTVKGRVICPACEAAMSHAAPNGPAPAGGVQAALARALPAANALPPAHALPPAGGAPAATALQSEPRLQHEHAAAHLGLASGAADRPGAREGSSVAPAAAATAPSSNTGIAWMAGIAIGFTALSIFVTDDRLARVDRAQTDLADGLAQRDAALRGLGEELNKVHPALAGVESRLAARLDASAQADGANAAAIGALQADLRRSAERFEALAREVADLRARVSEPGLGVAIERRFDELTARLALAEDERRELGARLAQIESGAVRAAEPAAAGPAPAAAAPAAWTRYLPDLKHAEEGVRWDAVSALGETGDPAVVPHVLPMLADASYIVRMAAARVLGEKLRAREAVPALITALEDSDSAVRESAWIALRTITGKDLKFESNANEAERAKRVKAWAEWWKKEGGGDEGKAP